MTIGEALGRLRKSDFRSRFHLSEKDREYIRQKGLPVIRQHAEDFVARRLAPAHIPNDGKQTPMGGPSCVCGPARLRLLLPGLSSEMVPDSIGGGPHGGTAEGHCGPSHGLDSPRAGPGK